ncbi:hypothetical protein A9Q83_06100 [Alphaproteobacteria bacterium 46_93_T64]|nr:hypothetical protein A9Q83_06100 [Alphaproteobacteria bacterium 46_93_T64]
MNTTTISRQAFKFAITGILNTGIDFAIFFTLIYVVSVHFAVANTVAFLIAVTVSYIINKNWTFSDQNSGHKILSEWIHFTVISIGGFILATTLLFILDPYIHVGAAKIIATGASFIWNFTLTRFYLWKN